MPPSPSRPGGRPSGCTPGAAVPSIPSAARRSSPRSTASATAIDPATVKLAVALTSMPRTGCLLDRHQPRGRHRQLDLQVGGERREPGRLGQHRVRIAVEDRADLRRQAPLPAPGLLVDRLERGGAANRDLLDEPPGDVALAPGRVLGGELSGAVPPGPALGPHDPQDDGRVRGGTRRPVRDRVREVVDPAASRSRARCPSPGCPRSSRLESSIAPSAPPPAVIVFPPGRRRARGAGPDPSPSATGGRDRR